MAEAAMQVFSHVHLERLHCIQFQRLRVLRKSVVMNVTRDKREQFIHHFHTCRRQTMYMQKC